MFTVNISSAKLMLHKIWPNTDAHPQLQSLCISSPLHKSELAIHGMC